MSTIRAVCLVYDPEWRGVSLLGGSPLVSRVSDQLAAAGYQVTNGTATKANSVENLLSFVDVVRVDLTVSTTTGATDAATFAATLRAIFVSVTGYQPASIAIVSAGQTAPAADPPSFFDRLGASLDGILGSFAMGTTILTWAIVVGGVVVVYHLAKNPGTVKKWIA